MRQDRQAGAGSRGPSEPVKEVGFLLSPEGFKYILHIASCWQSPAYSSGAQLPLTPTQRDTCPPDLDTG